MYMFVYILQVPGNLAVVSLPFVTSQKADLQNWIFYHKPSAEKEKEVKDELLAFLPLTTTSSLIDRLPHAKCHITKYKPLQILWRQSAN